MMNFDYFDGYSDEPAKIDVEDEKIQLQNLANFVGSHVWSYTPEAQETYGIDGEDHLGIIAQDLLKVPGLASAVKMDENGKYKVNTDYAALAALALVAALARATLPKTFFNADIETAETKEEIKNGQTDKELSDTVQTEIGEPAAEAPETGETVDDGSTAGTAEPVNDETAVASTETIEDEPNNGQ